VNYSIPHRLQEKLSGILPALHFIGAYLAFFLFYFFSALHSQLGHEISAGESPGFAWIGRHVSVFMAMGLSYLLGVSWLQHLWLRSNTQPPLYGLNIFIVIQYLSIVIFFLAFYSGWNYVISSMPFLLLASIFIQGFILLWHQKFKNNDGTYLLQEKESRPVLFLFLLFLLNLIIAYLDPSTQRFKDYVQLHSNVELFLQKVIPPLFAGTTGLWFGIGTLILITIATSLQAKAGRKSILASICVFLPFVFLSGFYAAICLAALTYAAEWQINKLNLKPAVFSLFFLLLGGGAALFSVAYARIIAYLPRTRKRSPVGIVCVSMGVFMMYPLVRLITSRSYRRSLWVLLLALTTLLCALVGYGLLYGDIFNPWFTPFSYLKGILLKITTIVAAGALVLVFEEFRPAVSISLSGFRRFWVPVGIVFLLGFLPFALLGKYPNAKATLLQFNEMTRVDAAYARELAGLLKLDRWVRMGQDPDFNNQPHPWPHPWKLQKTHASVLPENFNLMVIVVDALRGDAFHSAGYHRNLTPFLDQWAQQETVSFRRAYSQGGGSFAAFPFLVAGRSRFALYGPNLYRENLFLKIARAEGIEHYMRMQGFGPRSIYPPGSSVIELTIPRAVSDRRTATADEVFNAARNAIGNLPAGERFLGFLHLLDVHNDLWKKKDGIDFGDSPRDLYDNNLSYLDRALKRFVEWLKAENIYEKTVILFTSDHGEQFWEHGASLHGHTLYEEEIRIPAILLIHGIQGRFEDVPIIAADMAPTIAELAGYAIDPPYDDPHMGISLVPLIFNNDRSRYLQRDVVGRASFKRRYFLFRNWQWKLIYFAELDLIQLFNVAEDPMEKKNLIEEKPRLAAEMEQHLLRYLKQVEGKTYRPLLTQSSPHANIYARAVNNSIY
jgi:glucan phosphoethanolaminetransferase (alkaline phosphatase superfamily)